MPASSPNNSYFWHPKAHPADTIAGPQLVIAGGEDVYIIDGDGNRLLDGRAALWNVNLGYSAEPVKKAIAAQLGILPFYSSFRGTTNKPAEELARTLIEDWFGPEGMVRVFFTSGGSDSVETSLRLARQYWKIQKAQDRYKYIAFKKSYHGSHFGGDSVSGGKNARRTYEPLLPGCYHIPAPYAYRNPFDEQDPERLSERCLRMLEEEILFQGADTVAAFIAEPVLGAGGVYVPHPNFWPRVRQLCDKYGVLLIADETITGYGRTGFECGIRAWGVKPDLLSTAKAITGGYFPMGAVMINERIASAFEKTSDGIGAIGHGYTYSGQPVGCAAGLAALKMTLELRVCDNARVRGDQLTAGLEKLQQKHAVVGDVRTKGLMAAVELVADRKSKTPADKKTMERIFDAALAAGVMIRTTENFIVLSPPLILEESHVDELLNAVDAGLSAA